MCVESQVELIVQFQRIFLKGKVWLKKLRERLKFQTLFTKPTLFIVYTLQSTIPKYICWPAQFYSSSILEYHTPHKNSISKLTSNFFTSHSFIVILNTHLYFLCFGKCLSSGAKVFYLSNHLLLNWLLLFHIIGSGKTYFSTY